MLDARATGDPELESRTGLARVSHPLGAAQSSGEGSSAVAQRRSGERAGCSCEGRTEPDSKFTRPVPRSPNDLRHRGAQEVWIIVPQHRQPELLRGRVQTDVEERRSPGNDSRQPGT